MDAPYDHNARLSQTDEHHGNSATIRSITNASRANNQVTQRYRSQELSRTVETLSDLLN